MTLGRRLKRWTKAAIAPVAFLAITTYFAWSATQGNHGLVAFTQRNALLEQARKDNADAVADHDTWERRVFGLQGNHLDLDALDERARAMLNLADPRDVVVSYSQNDKLF